MLKSCGRPLLDAVFGGTLLQTIKCSNCGHLSRTFEEFLDLSLPVASFPTNKMHKSSSYLSKRQRKKKIKVEEWKVNFILLLSFYFYFITLKIFSIIILSSPVVDFVSFSIILEYSKKFCWRK